MQFISFLEGNMEILEFFYENGFAKQRIHPRRVALSQNSRILLCGTKYSGKKTLMQGYVQKNCVLDETLLIDFEDTRADKEYIINNIDSFIQEKGIKTLIYYAYTPDIPLPKAANLILVSHHDIEIDGFEKYRLKNLDFEEFLVFEKKSDPKTAFNNFLKQGNFPIVAKVEEFRKDKRVQELLQLIFKEDFAIFKEMLSYQGHVVSSYFLFNQIKKRHKISKDRFYDLFYQWEHDGYVITLPKWGAKRAAKKICFFDFTLPSRATLKKEFPKSFENMVVLELDEAEAYYLEPLGIYLPQKKEIVVAIPFGDAVRIQQKIDTILKKNDLVIEKITVITIATNYCYEIDTILCEVVPFYEWALGKDRDDMRDR